jgi:isopenicillin N synthase-like dioxygenase
MHFLTCCTLIAGFFYVSGHSISAAPLFDAVRSLFDLPEPDKAALDARLSPLHRGYTGLGGSHNCVPEDSCVVGPDRKESYLLGEQLAACVMTAAGNSIADHNHVTAMLMVSKMLWQQASCASSFMHTTCFAWFLQSMRCKHAVYRHCSAQRSSASACTTCRC